MYINDLRSSHFPPDATVSLLQFFTSAHLPSTVLYFYLYFILILFYGLYIYYILFLYFELLQYFISFMLCVFGSPSSFFIHIFEHCWREPEI